MPGLYGDVCVFSPLITIEPSDVFSWNLV